MKKKKILIISLITFILLAVIAISLIIFMPRKYYIPPHILAIYDSTANEVVEFYSTKAMYYGYEYTDVYEDRDGNLVFVLTREEKDKFINTRINTWFFWNYEFDKYNFQLTHNKSYNEIIIECTKKDYENNISYVDLEDLLETAGWCQAFMGVKPEDNRVRLQVIDIDTGEVLYERTVSNKE